LSAPEADRGFDEPWQAYAWVIAHDLCARGFFSPGEWSTALGAKLRARGGAGNLAYYEAVLDALEALLAEKSAVSANELAQLKDDWRAAYEHTPHGKPVVLQR
jgi:nitrile hydratase beta subunit-like protein